MRLPANRPPWSSVRAIDRDAWLARNPHIATTRKLHPLLSMTPSQGVWIHQLSLSATQLPAKVDENVSSSAGLKKAIACQTSSPSGRHMIPVRQSLHSPTWWLDALPTWSASLAPGFAGKWQSLKNRCLPAGPNQLCSQKKPRLYGTQLPMTAQSHPQPEAIPTRLKPTAKPVQPGTDRLCGDLQVPHVANWRRHPKHLSADA